MSALRSRSALNKLEQTLPRDFPRQIHDSVKASLAERLKRLAAT